jgi:alpha-1,3-rhamnosyl/mannosyltransferase
MSSKPLRIAFDFRVGMQEIGGIPRYVRGLVGALLEQPDIEVHLFYPQPLGSLMIDAWRGKALNLHPISCSSIVRWEQVDFVMAAKRAQFKHVHIFAGRGPFLSRGLRSTQMVYDTGPFIYRPSLRGPAIWIQNVYSRLSAHQSALHSDAVFTISDFSATEIARIFNIAREKITVLYPGVDSIFFNPSHLPEKLGLRNQGFFFHLSSLGGNKNTERVVSAHQQLSQRYRKEYPLVISGNSYLPRRFWEEIAPDSCIQYLGPVNDQLLASLYSHSYAFVWPSFWEGFGMPVIEAMAAGAPVITSNTTSLPEAAGEAAVYVDPESTEQIHDSMARIIQDHSLREELRRQGYARAAQFTWEKAASIAVTKWRKLWP